eukprot:s3055_g3.t1
MPEPINVVDVGSMLGDCCLWTLKREAASGRGLCRAYESNLLWARLATTSAELNGFRKEMLISEVLVRPEGPNSLDALLLSDLGGAMWVLKMHVDGTELELLQGAVQILKSGRVPLAVVRMDWQLQLNDGRFRPPPSDWRKWLRRSEHGMDEDFGWDTNGGGAQMKSLMKSGLSKLYELRFCHEQAVLVAKKTRATNALLRRNLNFTQEPKSR